MVVVEIWEFGGEKPVFGPGIRGWSGVGRPGTLKRAWGRKVLKVGALQRLAREVGDLESVLGKEKERQKQFLAWESGGEGGSWARGQLNNGHKRLYMYIVYAYIHTIYRCIYIYIHTHIFPYNHRKLFEGN